MADVRRILVVVAHPDDAEFGCAGSVARWVADGCEVFYCLFTSGNRGSDDPAMTPERLAAVREAEQRAAAARPRREETSRSSATPTGSSRTRGRPGATSSARSGASGPTGSSRRTPSRA